MNSTSTPWTCHYLPYKDHNFDSDRNNNKKINPSNTSNVNHKVENKIVIAIIDKLKRLVHQTDKTDINANLKLLGIEYFIN